jgi:hemerythrin-like domain-containing protein
MSTKASRAETARKSDATLQPVSEATREGDILDTLKKEHEEVKALLNQLQDAEAAKERRELVKKIKAALVPHTKAEEKVVYDAVIATAEEEAEVDGHEGYLEHEWASRTLQRLEAADSASTEHRAAARVLKDLVEHHIEEEEDKLWSDVRQHFDTEERARMNAEFEAAKRKFKPS